MLERCVSVVTIWFNKYSANVFYIPAEFVLIREGDTLKWRFIQFATATLESIESMALTRAVYAAKQMEIPFVAGIDDGDEYDMPKHLTAKEPVKQVEATLLTTPQEDGSGGLEAI